MAPCPPPVMVFRCDHVGRLSVRHTAGPGDRISGGEGEGGKGGGGGVVASVK